MRRFNKSQLIVVTAAIAVIGVIVLVKSFAATPTLRVLHPDFHARLGVPLLVTAVADPTDVVKISLSGPVSKTIYEAPVGANSGKEFTVKWNMRDLRANNYTVKNDVITKTDGSTFTISRNEVTDFYTLKTQILTSSGTERTAKTETFGRDYDGWSVSTPTRAGVVKGPIMGFDENNGIFKNGVATFLVNGFIYGGPCPATADPATQAGRECMNVQGPTTNGQGGHGFINGNEGVGYYASIDDPTEVNGLVAKGARDAPSNWKKHLDACYSAQVNCTAGLLGQAEADNPEFIGRLPDSDFLARIKVMKDNPGLAMYQWSEEIEGTLLHGNGGADEMRRWTDLSHKYDSQHPVRMNFLGDDLRDVPFINCGPTGFCDDSCSAGNYCGDRVKEYLICRIQPDFFSSTGINGNHCVNEGSAPKPMSVDMATFDYYPLYQWAIRGRGSKQDNWDVQYRMLENAKVLSKGLVPYGLYVEPVAIDTSNVGAPTPADLWNMVWNSVAGGAKQVDWFNYFGNIIPENLPIMKRVVDTTKYYANALEGIESDGVGRSDTLNGRVKYATRIDPAQPNKLFVFASSIDVANSGSATFTVGGSVTGIKAVDGCDYDANYTTCTMRNVRTLTASNNSFTDSFVPLGVHIYEITYSGTLTPQPQPGRSAPTPPPPPTPQCQDTIDNDADGKIDYPADPGCTAADDSNETDPPMPPNPSTGLLLGNQTIEGLADGIGSQQTEAWPFTSNAGAAGTASLYIDSATTATSVEVGLYKDASGSPGELLAKATINNPAKNAWNTANFDTNPTLVQNGEYWLAVLGINGTVTIHDRNGGGNCSAKVNAAPNNWTTLKNPFGSTGGSFPQCPVSAYVKPLGNTLDTTKPTAPTTFTAVNVTPAPQVKLDWSGATDNVRVTNYLVYRYVTSAGASSAAVIANLGEVATYTDTTASYSTGYSYYIVAKDAAGNLSPISAVMPVTTPAPPADSTPPTAFTVSLDSSGTDHIYISWTDSADPESGIKGYDIYRNGTKIYTTIGTNNPLATSYGESGTFTVGQQYTYVVKAINGNNLTKDSNSLAVTIQNSTGGPLPIPTLGAWSWCHMYNAGECDSEATWLQSIGVKKWIVMGAGGWDNPSTTDMQNLAAIAANHGLKIYWFVEPSNNNYIDDARADLIVNTVKGLPGTGGYMIANEPEFQDHTPTSSYTARKTKVRSLDSNTAHIIQGVVATQDWCNGDLSAANVDYHLTKPYWDVNPASDTDDCNNTQPRTAFLSVDIADDWGVDSFPIGWSNTAYDEPKEGTYPAAKRIAELTKQSGDRTHFVIQASGQEGRRVPTADEIREQRDCAILGMTNGGQPSTSQEVWIFYTTDTSRAVVQQGLSQAYQGCSGISTNPPVVTGDLDGDGHVTGHDLSMLLSKYNTTYPAYDLDGTAPITGHDLSMLLAKFGT